MAKMKLTPEPPATPDVELMEDLVRASLAVNPTMRGGLETADVVERLRQQATETPVSKSAPPPEGGGSAEERDARRANVEFFLKSKRREVREKLSALDEQRRQLEIQVEASKRRAMVELVDFLTLSGLDKTEASRVLGTHKELLSDLNTNAPDVLKKIEERRLTYDR
jgi:hypothetical protein